VAAEGVENGADGSAGTGGNVRILLATDGDGPATQALELVRRVASKGRTEVTVVTVASSGIARSINTGSPDELIRSAVASLREDGFEVESRVLDGRPAPAVLAEIADGGYEATVLGAGNRSLLGRLLLGSVSTKVLHASSTSVLIVHRIADSARPTRVMFATDGSSHADLAMQQMIALLDASSCEIEVVSVAEHLMPAIAFPFPREAHATGAPTPELEREWMEAASKTASDAADALEANGFKSSFRAILGAPSPRLIAEADATATDLVVVGSRGLGALERGLLGSVSDQIVRHAPATFVARS
jgi:nucleotide-binding universal stress UspA family protein